MCTKCCVSLHLFLLEFLVHAGSNYDQMWNEKEMMMIFNVLNFSDIRN